jgi:hypothetical protein
MQITEADFKEAEFVRHTYVVLPPAGTTLDAMLKPEYWVHVSKRLRPWDLIEVHSEDGTWFAELIVRSTGTGVARVAVKSHIEFKDGSAGMPDGVSLAGHEIKWRGRAAWGVVRLSDAAVLKSGLATKEDGLVWLTEHLRNLAA